MIKFTKKIETPKKSVQSKTQDENRFDTVNKAAKKIREKSDKTLFDVGINKEK